MAKSAPRVDPEVQEAIRKDQLIANLRSENSDLKVKYQAAIRGADQTARVLANLNRIVPALPPVEVQKPRLQDRKQVEVEALLLRSDDHAGEVVEADDMLGLNEYNMDIFSARTKRLADVIEDYVQTDFSRYDIRRLHVAYLGDRINGQPGVMHDELVRGGSSMTDSVIRSAHIDAQFTRQLAPFFGQIINYEVGGNHDRFTKKPEFKRAADNWSRMQFEYHALAMKEQKNVAFRPAKTWWRLEKILGWNFMFHHGDKIKGSGGYGGLPWYGILGKTRQFQDVVLKAYGEPFHFVCLGHFHTVGMIQTPLGNIVVNGAMKGGDEFAQGAVWSVTEAQQVLMIVHRKHGIMDFVPIKLGSVTMRDGLYPYDYSSTLADAIDELKTS